MASIGDVLRASREEQGRSVAEIADTLCITQAYVRAMEEDDVSSLPGLFFYKSFIRQYAALLGIDAKLVNSKLAALDADPIPAVEASPSAIRKLDPLVEENNRRYFADHPLGTSLAGFVAILVLCTGVYAIWSRPALKSQAAAPPVKAATEVQNMQEIVGPDVKVQPQTQAEAQAEILQTAAPDVPVAAATENTAAAQDANDSASTNSSVKRIVLAVVATERTWLQISSGGRTVFSGILQPSESKVLTGSEIATVKVGNAAGLEVRWNGKPIGPIGPHGKVRTVRFTAEDFEILPAPESESRGDSQL